MAWYEILAVVFGAIGGTGGLVSLYTAQAKRNGMSIDNLKKIIEEARVERDEIRKTSKEDKQYYEQRLSEMKGEIDSIKKYAQILVRATNTAWRCQLPSKPSECPVIKILNEECDRNEGICFLK
ncbi:MAG: hypothetical protein K2L50_00575 [Bacteroidales bacterium]|nr:hypothetical protein [Bacteroidales bacterium]